MSTSLKQTVISMIAGAVGAGLVSMFVAPSFATPSPEVMEQTIENALHAGRCTARAGIGRITGGSRCFSGEVMTGVWDSSLYCADIQVTCVD